MAREIDTAVKARFLVQLGSLCIAEPALSSETLDITDSAPSVTLRRSVAAERGESSRRPFDGGLHRQFCKLKSKSLTPMTGQLVKHSKLAVVLFLASVVGTMPPSVRASNRRETPLVRALKRARLSVVNIHSEKTTSAGSGYYPTSRPKKINGMGTGIVIDSRGYIVTNYHVVKDVDSLNATMVDGSTYRAKVVTFDKKFDLAIIRIYSMGKLHVMPMGTSSDLMIGESVFAVGNAFGYENTVTSGIVSAMGRNVEVNETQSYYNLIQTDASINPGNSGGPLINMDGEVIGINVAIRAGAQRIGFAIPIDDARKILAKLMSVERLNGLYHGLRSRDEKKGELRKLIVTAAPNGSPAKEAGFRSGDQILKAGGVVIVDRVDFERSLLDQEPGEEIDVVVKRNNSTKTLKLSLRSSGRRTALRTTKANVVRAQSTSNREILSTAWKTFGLRAVEMGRSSSNLFENTRYRGGMKIAEVKPGSVADLNGIQKGDILVGLHIWETVTHENLSYIMNHPERKSWGPLKFYILRDGETLYGYLHTNTETGSE